MPPRKKKSTTKARRGGKAWAGRFEQSTDPAVEAFTNSLQSDLRMAEQDIAGSLAHVGGLERAGILTASEARRISTGLRSVGREIRDGKFRGRPSDEDVHMAVERRLTEIVGPVGGKVHTGRSRNDQIATDGRLWLRDEIDRTDAALRDLIRVLAQRARKDHDVVLPGYTHLQRAQPVLLAHHWLAYVEMFRRDLGRLADCRKRVNVMPLGAGALAGAGFRIDRARVARELGFDAVTRNSLDAVSDRDFVIEFLSVASTIAMHVSRLSEEIVLWASEEFRFIELPDAFATGSSMMPQKKNPDVAELARGRTGRIYGSLVSVLTMMKGLPLTYNRDMQDDKPPLFEAADVLSGCLTVFTRMLPHLRIRADRMEAGAGGFALATELADYLVERGLPFRQAHEVVGQIVGWCVGEGRELESVSTAELTRFSPLFERGAGRRLDVRTAISRRSLTGGTAQRNVDRALEELEAEGLLPSVPARRRKARR